MLDLERCLSTPPPTETSRPATHRIVALELVGWTEASVWIPSRTVELIGGILAVLVSITDERFVDTVVAQAAELIV